MKKDRKILRYKTPFTLINKYILNFSIYQQSAFTGHICQLLYQMKLYLDIDSGGHLDIVHNDAIAEPDFLADDTVCPEADAGQAGLLADDSAGTNTAVCQLANRSILR